MVQLQAVYFCCLNICQQVSIPSWYNYKFVCQLNIKFDTEFKFLHGTITSSAAPSVSFSSMKFQFLHGTITSSLPICKTFTYICFNSFMVQLQALIGGIWLMIVWCFNSFMVQLQAQIVGKTVQSVFAFQFLHGTITSTANNRGKKHRSRCFNSFMVQLQVFFCPAHAKRVPGFNSFMVQLQGVFLLCLWRWFNKFQFLHGTITSCT